MFNIAVFLDLQKAFDTKIHKILLKKLDFYGMEQLPDVWSTRRQVCLPTIDAKKALTDIFQRTSSSQYYNLRGSSTKLYFPNSKAEYL